MTNKYDQSETHLAILHTSDESELMHFLQENLYHQAQGIFNLESDGSTSLHHAELLARPKDGSSIQNWINQLEDAGNAHVFDHANIIMVGEMMDNLKNPIALNISAQSFGNEEFCGHLKEFANRCKEAFKDKEQMISIEITESAAIANLDTVRKSMEHIHSCGMKVYADDFGASSGHMNEDVIESLPFDSVKLDRDLVQNLDDPHCMQRAENMIAYAKENNISVVAEYVENEEVMSQLVDMGITLGQGYHLEKPRALEFVDPTIAASKQKSRDSSSYTM